MEITKKIAEELSVKPSQVEAAVKLIDEGCTIPFIARYRKEVQVHLMMNSFVTLMTDSNTFAILRIEKHR